MNRSTMGETIESIFTLSPQDRKDLTQKTLKLGEEYGELAQAVLSSEGVFGCGYKNMTREEVLEEGVDVIMVAFSVLEKAGFTQKQVQNMLEKKLIKWWKKMQEEQSANQRKKLRVGKIKK